MDGWMNNFMSFKVIFIDGAHIRKSSYDVYKDPHILLDGILVSLMYLHIY